MKKPDVISSIDLNVEGPTNENSILFYHCESEFRMLHILISSKIPNIFFAEITFAVTR